MIARDSVILKEGEFIFPSVKVDRGDLIEVTCAYNYSIIGCPDLFVQVLDGDQTIWSPLKHITKDTILVLKRGVGTDPNDPVYKWAKELINERVMVDTKPQANARITSPGFDLQMLQIFLLAQGVVCKRLWQMDKVYGNKRRWAYVWVSGIELRTFNKAKFLCKSAKEMVTRVVAAQPINQRLAPLLIPPMNPKLKFLLHDVVVSSRLQKDNEILYRDIVDYLKIPRVTQLDKFLNKFSENIKQNSHADALRKLMDVFSRYAFIAVKEVEVAKGDRYELPQGSSFLNGFKVYDGSQKKINILDL